MEMMKEQALLIEAIYVALLYAFAEKDDRLARHLETCTVFSVLSNRII